MSLMTFDHVEAVVMAAVEVEMVEEEAEEGESM